MHDDVPFIADAAFTQIESVPPPPLRPRRAAARRALGSALVGVVFLGFVFGPLALSLGHRARLAMLADDDLDGASTVRAAILLGRVGMALHLTLVAAALPWLLFVPSLLQGG
jgi:hypothetical protein